MTAMTRDQQFIVAFSTFMNTHFVDKGKLNRWNIELLTKNTRKNIHEYKVTFPETYLAYHLDCAITRRDGTIEGPGPVYLPQPIPDIVEYMVTLGSYFTQFRCYDHITSKLLSAVSLGDYNESDKSIQIFVTYYKQFYPYPTILTREQQLEIQLHEMTRRALIAEESCQGILGAKHAAEQHIDDLTEFYTNLIGEHQRLIDLMKTSYVKSVRDSYENAPKDCPVCMDPIPMENLGIPICGHLICTDCKYKCANCPICREPYFM